MTRIARVRLYQHQSTGGGSKTASRIGVAIANSEIVRGSHDSGVETGPEESFRIGTVIANSEIVRVSHNGGVEMDSPSISDGDVHSDSGQPMQPGDDHTGTRAPALEH
ncbi:hypothetical protein BHE74_00006826 [Ensete ventricosum]|nr:hypothetical protein BHE74_00006826 [Ensete ventricosum]RZR91147.1 hypothetical protein BHM03_00019210 [Ensete ventricosum]